MPTRETFERHLKELQDEVLVLGSMAEQAVQESVKALRASDRRAAVLITKNDAHINEKRYTIENNCLTLIATQQPMARDLRLLAAILEINTELERIGDYAKGIARIVILMGDRSYPIPTNDIQLMADQGLASLHRALTAFIERDADAARSIAQTDDRIDSLYNHLQSELIHSMIDNPAHIDTANYLSWAAHNLERLGDRVTNICERTVFVVTGEMHELDRSDDEHPRDPLPTGSAANG